MLCVKPLQNKKRTLKRTFFFFFTKLEAFSLICAHLCCQYNQQAGICPLSCAVRLWHHGACYCKQTLLPSWALSSIGCLLSTLTSKSYKPGGLAPSSGSHFLGQIRAASSGSDRKRETQAEAVTSRFAHWNYKVFHLEFSRFQHDDDVKVGGYVRPDSLRHSGGNVLKC